jgi:hypothetical protein
MEALGMVLVEQQSTLLVTYDLPAPSPLLDKRPVQSPVGVGVILTPRRTANTLARVSTKSITAKATPMNESALEAMRSGNPAARALPLLQLLAYRRSGSVALSLPNNASIEIHLEMEAQ